MPAPKIVRKHAECRYHGNDLATDINILSEKIRAV